MWERVKGGGGNFGGGRGSVWDKEIKGGMRKKWREWWRKEIRR